MMQYVLNVVWAAARVAFAYLFFGIFLERKKQPGETRWFLLCAWLVSAVLGLFREDGQSGYMIYLLTAVLMLLCLFGENGLRGLSLLVFAAVIPACCSQLPLGQLLPLACVLVLRLFRKQPSHVTSEETDALLLRQHMEMQQESMRALEQNYRVQRKNAHEFEHHMQVLRDLMGRGETAAAQDYLERLKKNRSMNVMTISSHHPVADVILNQKHQTAQENEINMQVQVNDLSAVDIPADSLVVVLTNLLDNAIEACRRIDGYREILCTILYDDGLYISIRNTSLPVQVVDGRIPTSKQDALNHGFGLISVGYVLDTLGAEYSFGYEQGWFHFAAEISLDERPGRSGE